MRSSFIWFIHLSFSTRISLVQLDNTRPLYGCLAQNHLQLDILNFDLHNLMVLMFVSDLSCMAVYMVCLFMFLVCSLIYKSYVLSQSAIGTGASLASSARRVQGKFADRRTWSRIMDVVTQQFSLKGCGTNRAFLKE